MADRHREHRSVPGLAIATRILQAIFKEAQHVARDAKTNPSTRK
jgi:hypothetical protein